MSYLLLKEPPLGLEANFGHVSATFGTYRQTNKLKFSTQITSDCLSLFIVLSCFFLGLRVFNNTPIETFERSIIR